MDTERHARSFPRRYRLKSPTSIRLVSRDGLRSAGSGFVACWATEREVLDRRASRAEGPCIAFVVSRHSGKAHQRNRIKRRLREAVRLNRDHWPRSAGRTYIVFRAVGSTAAEVSFQDLTESVRDVMSQVGTRKKGSGPWLSKDV